MNSQIRAIVATDINGNCVARCQICHGPLTSGPVFYDAATKSGPWGWLCETCFNRHGIDVGVGQGQEYDSKTLLKLRG